MNDVTKESGYMSEIQQKVGRNVIAFQHMELMLKYLLTYARFEIRGKNIVRGPEDNHLQVSRKTLGPVVDQYLKEIIFSETESANAERDPNEAYHEFSFRVESGKLVAETKKQALEAIVNERNELVHNLLPRIKPGNSKKYQETIQFLDEQFETITPHIEDLKSQCAAMKKFFGELTPERIQKQIHLAWLRQSRLVLLLGDIASQMARQDGWTLLNVAGQLVREHEPIEMQSMREKYGHKTLKQLLVATELFDLMEEATEKGIRVLYRLKPGWSLEYRAN